ncbi:hypothetical protein ACHAXR_004550 [Thalassiosira sp. AJA248-18]
MIPMTRNASDIRISFQLHDPQSFPFRNEFSAPAYLCRLGELPKVGGIRTGEIPRTLLLGGIGNYYSDTKRSGGRVLDFTTTISSNLNILQIGDSLTIQLAQALDEMLGSTGHELPNRRHQIWEAYKGGEGGTLVAPTRGGGIHGAWRITGLLSAANRGKPETKNKVGGGWNYHQVFPFLRHIYPHQGQNVTVGKIDVVIFRVMHGWMTVEEITRERVVEAAELAHSVLGAETIVFFTVPMTNNVKTVDMLNGVNGINDMIRDVARNWHLQHNSTTVLVMDYAAYSNHVMWTNARQMGYNVSNPLDAAVLGDSKVFDLEGPKFLLERLKLKEWPPSIPMVCSKKPPPESGGAYCERNILFNDGMHMCTETLAARLGSAIACLLGCVYNRRGGGSKTEENSDTTKSTLLERRELKIRACERQCNEQFMSVMPMKESWINHATATTTTLASFSDG